MSRSSLTKKGRKIFPTLLATGAVAKKKPGKTSVRPDFVVCDVVASGAYTSTWADGLLKPNQK
jgi:hypothetical protein